MRGVAIAALLLTLALLGGCATATVTHPAVTALEGLLELRRADVRDAEAYAPYFAEPSIASALAAPSDVPTGTPRVPEWEPPYVSAETSGSVDVVVVWKADEAFPEWPPVNIFRMEARAGEWVVIDAIEATSTPAPVE